VSKVELLVAGLPLSFTRTDDRISFTLPLLADYEVAAII